MAVVTSAISSVAAGSPYSVTQANFNVSLSGTFVATAQLERSFDAGSNWLPITGDLGGTPLAFSAPVSFSIHEPEAGVTYRWNVTAYTSGSVVTRISP